MRKILALILTLSSFLVAKDVWIYNVKTDIIDPKTNEVVGEIYEGTPVKLIEEKGEFSLIEVTGETVEGKENTLAYSKAPLVTFLTLKDGVAKTGEQYLVKSSDLADREYPSWEEIELVYYDSCTSCHGGHHPTEHLMAEWDAYLSAMQYFAKINDEEMARMLRFLEAHARDGFAKEEE
ncbi:MAG: hypothetical protein GX282_05485 [Campylobacteraceae bacterium]|nr:hypothetical protein [Campylobacteraceae bacterium]